MFSLRVPSTYSKSPSVSHSDRSYVPKYPVIFSQEYLYFADRTGQMPMSLFTMDQPKDLFVALAPPTRRV